MLLKVTFNVVEVTFSCCFVCFWVEWRAKSFIVDAGKSFFEVECVPFDVVVTVKSVKGTCDFGCKVGDKVVFDGRGVKGDICYSALMAILPKVYAFRYGAEFPWAENKDVISNVCPDPENPVLFEIKRIRK